jgi:hypothetical protein
MIYRREHPIGRLESLDDLLHCQNGTGTRGIPVVPISVLQRPGYGGHGVVSSLARPFSCPVWSLLLLIA